MVDPFDYHIWAKHTTNPNLVRVGIENYDRDTYLPWASDSADTVVLPTQVAKRFLFVAKEWLQIQDLIHEYLNLERAQARLLGTAIAAAATPPESIFDGTRAECAQRYQVSKSTITRWRKRARDVQDG